MAEPKDCHGWGADPVSMSGYLDRMEGASETLPFVETRVALLTGQSSFVSSALSPAQISFLRAVAPAGASVLEMGFPFDSSFFWEGFREAGMAVCRGCLWGGVFLWLGGGGLGGGTRGGWGGRGGRSGFGGSSGRGWRCCRGRLRVRF